MNPQIIIKGIRIKIALNRLSRAKENAIRIHQGLPPIRPWYQMCYINVMTSLRMWICEAFFPCCIYKLNRNFGLKIGMPSSPCKRLFTIGTYENNVLKNCLGFLGGILFTMFLYFTLVFKLKFQPMTSSVACSALGLFLTIGLAFFFFIRCIILLIIPQLFSSTGRSFLMLYVMVLVLNNPVRNFNNNIVVMSESSTCGQQMAYNQTKELVEAAVAPLAGVIGSVKMIMKSLEEFSRALRHSFTVLKKAVDEIAAAIGRVLSWLKSIVTVCNRKMGAPYRKCVRAFDTAERNCRNALGWFLGWICGIVTAVKQVCHVVRIGELLCVIAKVIKDLVADKLGKPVGDAISGIYEMFYFNVTVQYSFKFNMTQSKTFSQVKDDILKEVKERVSGFVHWVDIIEYVMMFSLVFVLIKALMYRRKYLTNDRFDNIYITFNIHNIDERRKEIGSETILPLSWKESAKYIKTTSMTLAKGERSKLAKGIVRLLISFTYSSFYMMCDHGLFWLLDMLRTQFEIKTHAAVPPHLKIHVQGEGAIADMYRALVGFFDPLKSGVNVDTTPCLPNPSRPNYGIYKEIWFIFGICLFMTVFQSYGLRLRHVITSCYYPRRERERAVWLYNHILKSRGGFLKFARRQLRRKYMGRCDIEKSSIRGKLAAKYPVARNVLKYFGWDRKMCLNCGKEGLQSDMDNFQHCANAGCNAIYCMDCFDDLNNLCTVCMNPVDYGDFSDVSEERDSSEDEETEKLREEALIKREERRKQRSENTAEKMVSAFQNQLGITESRIEDEAYLQQLSYESSLRESTEQSSSSDISSDSYYDDSYQYQSKLSSDPEGPEWKQWQGDSVKRRSNKPRLDLVSSEIFDSDASSDDSFLLYQHGFIPDTARRGTGTKDIEKIILTAR